MPSYLHPSQKNLKTEQIGPSSHKNEFHAGVLEGNWFEERFSFGKQPSKHAKFCASSTAHDAFPPLTAEQCARARPREICNQEAPRNLLLGHGPASTSYLTVNELSYTNLSAPDSKVLSTNELPKIQGVSSRRALLEKKRAQWAEDTGDRDFVTMKNATFDATGTYVAQHPQPFGGPCTRRGVFLHSLESPMYNIHLRE